MFRNAKPTMARIGIFHPQLHGWMAGDRYLRTLIHSLARKCESAAVELYVLCEHNGTACQIQTHSAKVVQVGVPEHNLRESRFRRLLSFPRKSQLIRAAREHGISVLLPFSSMPFRLSHVKTIGWIPDFQHLRRPEFFSERERQGRDHMFRLVAERCNLVIVSSQNALEDFVELFPGYARKARLLPFPSIFAFEHPTGDVLATLRKFNLPRKFLLIANQFWRHKNHEVVIEAVRQLNRKGTQIPAVITGLPLDYRDANNETTSRILQAIASAGLNQQITVLGMLDESDFCNLMRAAAVVVQPSLFEGWSTVIQDVKALGRPLVCSDIPVHREQAPEALGFFPCNRPDHLAELLNETWPILEPGPDFEKEKEALARELELAGIHGQTLLGICKEAYSGAA